MTNCIETTNKQIRTVRFSPSRLCKLAEFTDGETTIQAYHPHHQSVQFITPLLISLVPPLDSFVWPEGVRWTLNNASTNEQDFQKYILDSAPDRKQSKKIKGKQ